MKKYIYKPNIYYPLNINNNNINLSYKGLDTECFSIINNDNNFGLDTHILFEQKPGVLPEVSVNLQINETTSQMLHLPDLIEPSNNTIYHIIYDSNSLFYDNSKAAIIEYTWQDDSFIFNNIINSGVFRGNEYSISTIGSTIGCSVETLSISNPGIGYKLGSTFYLGRSHLTSNHFEPDCIFTVGLILCSDTVIISGGDNYKVGETFTISGADTPGLIEIDEVDNTGSITSTTITITGRNFTTVPIVTYNGEDGEGADIEINDSFSISSPITIIDSGNAYTVHDSEILASYDDSFYEVSIPASCIVSLEDIKITPIVTDNFSLSDSIDIITIGNNVIDNNFQLVSKNNVINNTYINLNLDYLVDNIYDKSKVRPKFYY